MPLRQVAVRGDKFQTERAGFEPANPLRSQQLSRLLLSATQPPLHISRQSLNQKNVASCLPGFLFETRQMFL